MLELLKSVTLFNKLNDVQLNMILGLCRRQHTKANTLLFREKEPGDAFYILIDGSVKIFTSGQSGEEKILSVLRAGESFGELALIDGKPRSASAATLEDSVLLALPTPEFLEVLRRNFDMTLGIMQELAQRLRDTNQHVHDLTFLDARTRVLKNLIVMANKGGRRDGQRISIRMALNYQDLSRMAGVSQQELREVLRDLQDKQLLLFSDDGFVLDLAKIRN